MPLEMPRVTHLRALIDQCSHLLLPGRCVLCGCASNRALDMCPACETSLPLNLFACAQCALPLPQNRQPTISNAGLSAATPDNRKLFCGACTQRPPAFTRIVTPFVYRAPMDNLLWQFKFNGNLPAGRVLARLLAREIERQINHATLERPHVLIPVPLSWHRRMRRGFNQAQILARALGQQIAVPVLDRGIKRSGQPPPQRGLNRNQRRQNLKSAFRGCENLGARIEGKSVALVDDIVTTGSTAETLAGLLCAYGASRVQVWAVARTPLEN